jgi:hypothetical protein
MKVHVAVYSETNLGWHWCCTTCEHLGNEKYPTQEHARKGFWLHAEYEGRPRSEQPRRRYADPPPLCQPVVSVNGKPVAS